MTYSRLGSFQQARAAYRVAIRLDTANPDGYFHMGLDDSAMGNHQAAVNWRTQAHTKVPDRPDISNPEMIRRSGGSIVVTGSVQSVAAQRNSTHYVVSKHGLLGLVRCLGVDYAKKNIRANCVLPERLIRRCSAGPPTSILIRTG